MACGCCAFPCAATTDTWSANPTGTPSTWSRRGAHRVGTRFIDLTEIKRYVRKELRGMSVFGQVRVIDDDGAVLMYGFRSGPGVPANAGPGVRRPPQPPEQPRRAQPGRSTRAATATGQPPYPSPSPMT